ncbi:helix-turn-helix transcriptional regulator [Paenibacillus sp. D2_2]|uniref:helix-turn-helix domain-containing protein n=1 Tax=Paenibacillus sp. D2_2 TaxID=3073092 RepID=UPI0028150503|nr:helix-turn-helix transcriptional regulator [Paenibacillus sp. D2_2]WMT40499.1 helix-turn-helix transcriptional regulator [Paenibacillus sp. D2_2]
MLVLGDRIKNTRISREWTQEELGKKISTNTTKHVISSWERGKSNPDPTQIIALANALEVSSDYLLGLSNFPEPHFRDPFGQLSIFPQIDYAFVKGASWDLPKLINSGISLFVENKEISYKDKQMLTSVIEITMRRMKEVEDEIKDELLNVIPTLDEDSSIL